MPKIVAALTVVLVLAWPAAAAPSGHGNGPLARCGSSPRLVAPASTGSAELAAVDATGQADGWAVGTAHGATHIQHWDGSAWAKVASPSPGTASALFSTAAIGPSNAWAVGAFDDATGHHSLIERWNGSAWSVSPNNGIADLNGVDAVSSTDVWAGGAGPSLMHWNGASWAPGQPPPTEEGELHAVSARAHRDVWAVGEQDVESQPGPVVLILRWNGTVWKLVPHPLLDVDDSELFGVAALSATDVWFVGQTDSEEQGQRTLIEHWDGSSVEVVPSPSPGTVENVLSGVSAVSASDVWATGSYSDGAVAHPLVEHWDGTTWSVVSAQDPLVPGSLAGLAGVVARPGGDVWAVGSSGPDSLQPRPMIEHNAQVSLTDGGFAPPACGVTAGSTVYWSADAANHDRHTATSRTGLFDSGPLGPGSLFSFTFGSAGSFGVVDSETGHRSKIVVR